MDCSMPGLPVHHKLPELTQTHVHRVGDAIQLSHLLSSPSPPAFTLSQRQGLFNWVRWSNYWSFSFNISPSNKYSGLISFRMDWLDLLAVQGTLNQQSSPTPQFKSINSSALSFFIVQFSYPYMTTGKTTALTIQTFFGKVTSLPFNSLSRFFIAFLQSSKRLLISWLQSPQTMILEPKKVKSVTVSIVSPPVCPEVMGPDAKGKPT